MPHPNDNADLGIYGVETLAGRRFVVLAQSADEAAATARNLIAREADVPLDAVDDADTYLVGRFGNWNPGPNGTRFIVSAGFGPGLVLAS